MAKAPTEPPDAGGGAGAVTGPRAVVADAGAGLDAGATAHTGAAPVAYGDEIGQLDVAPAQEQPASHRLRTARYIVAAAVVAGFASSGIWVWQRGGLTSSEVAAWIASLGAWAPVVFSVVFLVGLQMGLPGMLFVVGARLAFGPYVGFALSYGVGLLGIMVPFVIGRALRSNSPWHPKNRWLAAIMGLLERRPLLAVVLVRAVFWYNSPVAYALAASRISWRTYALGCALAMAPVVLLAVTATGWFL